MSPFAKLLPYTPIWLALEDVESMVKQHMQTMIQNSTSESEASRSTDDLEDTEVSFLFALGVMKN